MMDKCWLNDIKKKKKNTILVGNDEEEDWKRDGSVRSTPFCY
jgi:hypothetical protein